MFFEILKASKGLYTDNIFAEMWGKRLAGQEEWQVTEITGYLPLMFLAKGEAFKNYRIHGTAEGAGVKTVNLFDKNATDSTKGYVSGYYLNTSGSEISNQYYNISEYIEVETGVRYFYSNLIVAGYDPAICVYDANKTFISGIRIGSTSSIKIPVNGRYVRLTVQKSNLNTALFYRGYQIPLTVTSGQNTDTYPLYIGSTKLGEEEYLDYQEQKVYKLSADLWDVNGTTTNQHGETRPGNEFAEGLSYVINNNNSVSLYYRLGVSSTSGYAIQPNGVLKITPNDTLVLWTTSSSYMPNISVKTEAYTDPPAPFPAITAYKGENTLSSTETVGEVTIKGKIKTAQGG